MRVGWSGVRGEGVLGEWRFLRGLMGSEVDWVEVSFGVGVRARVESATSSDFVVRRGVS